MKKTVKNWELNDYDGQFSPYAITDDNKTIMTLHADGDLCLERDSKYGEQHLCWVPVEVVAEYLRMLGWIVIAPVTKK